MGEVYLGLQEGIGGFERLVAIKRIHEELAQVEEFAALFLREARLAATLQHPHIVRILNVGQDSRGLYAALEYVSGETIEYICTAKHEGNCPRMPWQHACWLVTRIADALHYAHAEADASRPIIHRDVSPSNVLVGYDGRPVLLDFGIANAADGLGTERLDMIVGTVGYQSPEQIANIEETPASDVFQLATILFELVTGSRLIAPEDEHQAMLALVESPLPKAKDLDPDLPDALCDLLDSALTIDWEQRIQSADEFRRRLDEILQGEEGVGRSELATWMSEHFAGRRKSPEELKRICRQETRRLDSPRIPPLHTATTETATAPDVVVTSEISSSTNRRRSRTAVMLATVALLAAGLLFLLRGSETKARPADEPLSSARPVTPTTEDTADPPALPSETPQEAVADAASPISVRMSVQPKSATIHLNGEPVGIGSFAGEVARDQAHEIVVEAPGYRTSRLRFTNEAPPALVSLNRAGPDTTPVRPRGSVERDTAKKPNESDTPEKIMGTDNIDPWADQ